VTPLPSLLLVVLIAAAPSSAPASAATLAVSAAGAASPVVCGVAKENRTLVCALVPTPLGALQRRSNGDAATNQQESF